MIDGSSKVEKAGCPRPLAGIARAQTFYRCSAELILMLLPNGVFRSWSWSARHRAWSSSARSSQVGHRAHLLPQFNLREVGVSRGNVLGSLGGGLALTAACFTGAAALVGIFAVALMRAAFEFTLAFARTERRGGIDPIIEHQAVGYALADAKTAIEATRCFCWRACHAVDMQSPGAQELAIEAKIYGSETAVRVLTDLMRVVGIESYDHAASVRAPAAGCARASSVWRGQHRRPAPTTPRDLETAGIRSAGDQRRGGSLTKRSFFEWGKS